MAKRRAERVSAVGWLGQVLAWLVIGSVVIVLAVAVVIPRVAGATPYTILTSSMTPGMPPGTLVVVKPVSPDDISIGTVITYQLNSGDPTVVTHRVVAQGFDLAGNASFTTQGDANDSPDENPVLPVQIKGERWYSVPQLGRLTNVIDNDQRQIAVIAIVTALFGYAAIMFVGAARDRRTAHQRDKEGAAA